MATQNPSGPRSRPVQDPGHWKTGDEPMTREQRAYLETLTREAGEDLDPDEEELSKAEAALRIEELERRTRREPGE